jgi:hypothetical protein
MIRSPRRRLAGIAVGVLAFAIVAAAAGSAGGRNLPPPSPSEANAIRESAIEARLRQLPQADAEAHFELAEELAELATASSADAAMADALRRLVGELCGWAVRLDASLAPSALRLMLEVETDPQRRRRLRRLLRVDAESADDGDPARRLEIVRSLAAIHRGHRRGIEEALASPVFAAWLDEHPEAVAAGLGSGRSEASARIGRPPLEGEEALRLFEIERAWLAPARAGFAGSLRIGGRAPLPEIGREELSQWLGAGGVRSWEAAAGTAEAATPDGPAAGVTD